jgi:hypothetical protein
LTTLAVLDESGVAEDAFQRALLDDVHFKGPFSMTLGCGSMMTGWRISKRRISYPSASVEGYGDVQFL